MALPQEYYFFKAPEDRDIRVAWLNRVKQPPDLVLNLKDLPAEQAIPRIGWFMSHLNRPTAESQRIGRQEILKFPEWRKILSDKLEALSQIKTPPDLFGPDWRRLSMSREMAKQRDDAKWGGFKARSAQGRFLNY